ncbi:acyltransferase family protein [Mixta intestinalis]|uniref:O-acetyltransferase OatA n=1 Tax=Mixta intestinalis TaxID=1615494 RepID=A0A6P1PX59_9GAMM|nr:acyltransferase family protein [Mixta intestinalis]QHM70731.1 O-acetyltransferase OatA [Mixta intestinalis]
MRYRSDIDGLRAVAVLFVLMFHGGLSVFPSGFIGVDIFFVISGFLITSIISTSLKNQSFSLSEFYVRRLWRLQPALITVVIFTLVLTTIFYLPTDFIDYIRSAKYTTLFTSNQYFARSTTGYAAPDTANLLLLHTWSLSIEWQWYLLLPAGVLLLNRYFSDKTLKIATVAITIGMLGLSLYLSDKYPNKSYYFLSPRIFEFMIGSCLVVLNHERLKLTQSIASVLGVLSLATIIYCATRTNIVLGYPDYHAVIVSIASALLILVGTSTNGIASRILSLSPLVFIGSISYSLYLWHWPIFATGRYLGLTENTIFKISCYAVTFIAAYLSYIFIEKPCRKIRWTLTKSLSILALVPAGFFLVLYPVSEKYKGFNIRFGSEYARIESTLQKYASPYRESCLNGNTDGTDKNCIVGDISSNKRALLIGDSNSNHFWSFFDVLAKDAHMSVTVQGTSSCLTLPGIYQFDWWYFKNTVYQECHDNTERYYDNIKKGKFDYVIIGEVWMNYAGNNIINRIGDKRSVDLSRERIEVAMRKALDIIVKSGARPVIIKTIYTMPPNYMNCFYQHIKTRKDYISNSCNPTLWGGDNNEWFTQIFNKMKKDYPSLIVIDPKDVQCSGKTCKTDIDGVPVYRDVGHFTDYASYKFGEEYLIQSGNPFR